MKAFPDLPAGFSDDKLLISKEGDFDLPVDENELLTLLKAVEAGEGVSFFQTEVVYVDEQEIIRINKKYLDKSYVTDIITFRYDENTIQAIEGTLYCCAPRILEQSREFNTDAKNEFYRVFVHGLIHLAGYNDQTEAEKKVMTSLENRYLESLNSSL